VGFLNGEFLGFHPKDLSETPLYKEISLVEFDLDIPLIGVLSEEVREGGIGAPAIVRAKDLLISILGVFGYMKVLVGTRHRARDNC
jgi:hypothetical protein